MVIYNVTVKVSHEIAEDWVKWMQSIHIPEVMATESFIKHQLCHLLDYDDEEGQNYTIQYFCTDMSTYENYMKNLAPALQAKHLTRYGDKALAFRTLMRVL